MPRLSVSRRARLGITAGVLATASVATAFSIGTANAATDQVDRAKQGNAEYVLVDFAKTKLMSVKVHGRQEDGTLISRCVTNEPDPRGTTEPANFKADFVLIQSFVTVNCAGDKLHSDTVSHASDTDTENFWVIPLETLDDDDPTEWTK